MRMIWSSRFWMTIRIGREGQPGALLKWLLTLNLLSCNTLLIAASSPLGDNFVWKTTPKEPFPTILHWVYCISRSCPVTPSWTFSRITSVAKISITVLFQMSSLCEDWTHHPSASLRKHLRAYCSSLLCANIGFGSTLAIFGRKSGGWATQATLQEEWGVRKEWVRKIEVGWSRKSDFESQQFRNSESGNCCQRELKDREKNR